MCMAKAEIMRDTLFLSFPFVFLALSNYPFPFEIEMEKGHIFPFRQSKTTTKGIIMIPVEKVCNNRRKQGRMIEPLH